MGKLASVSEQTGKSLHRIKSHKDLSRNPEPQTQTNEKCRHWLRGWTGAAGSPRGRNRGNRVTKHEHGLRDPPGTAERPTEVPWESQ